MTNDIATATTEQRQARHPAGWPARRGIDGGDAGQSSRLGATAFARHARRAGQVVLAAAVLMLVSASAAAAATPVIEAKKERDASDITIGVVIILVLVVVLFLVYRLIRRR
ncbi:hypothetical protein BL253_15820 [Pseudofrankia asymbiotica]|uniref:Uncharacterized protein n=2 Tax=Pseudofrankia asymbiotica TaxID=1834516 RepID=A0A1V2IAA3_9ACTN|nr:hypothetical protein BL253_15820 [Pseudofrankia asymbiotica]